MHVQCIIKLINNEENMTLKKRINPRNTPVLPLYHKKGFQLVYLIMIMGLFFLKSFMMLHQYNVSEPLPPIFPNLAHKEQQFGFGAEIVNVGLFIKNFPEFDVQAGIFSLEGEIWFDFNPHLLSLQTIENFQFEKASHFTKSPPLVKLIGKRLFAIYPISVKFNSDLMHHLFPFNDHRIYLTMTIDKVSPKEILFEASQSGLRITNEIKPHGWTPVDFDARSGYIKNSLDIQDQRKFLSYPAVVFAVTFIKPGFRNVFVILGPSIFLFFCGLLSLLIEGKPGTRLTIVIGSLTGLLVHRFVIEQLSPSVGYYTPVDYLYVLFLLSTFIILIINIYELEKPMQKNFKNAIFYAIQIFTVAIFYGLTSS